MIELQTIRRGDTRQIIRIKGILPKDRLELSLKHRRIITLEP